MGKTTLAVVGVLGFGKALIKEILYNAEKHNCTLKAIIDISPNAKDMHRDLIAQGVKYYKTLDDMYTQMDIDIVLIASPIQFHSIQACKAMKNGSHVMLEKPIAGAMEDVTNILSVRDETGKKILIGFQLCYDETIRKVKEIIMSGALGKMHTMKCIVLWPRGKAYYARNNWAGVKYDAQGRSVFDSVANNATAHYFMNLLFLAGDDMQSAAKIEDIDAKIYKAYPIETFDTCIVKAKLSGDVEMMAIASHVTQSLHNPEIEIIFDNGKIVSTNSVWYVEINGKSTIIGTAHHASQQKIWDMVRFVNDDTHLVKCSVEMAMAHTQLIELISKYDASTFTRHIIENEECIYVDGLEDILKKGYLEFSMNIDALDALCGV